MLPRGQSPVEKSDPNPSQQQEENHEGEGKRKPGAKIDEVTVWKVATQQGSGGGREGGHQKVKVVTA